MTNQSEVPPGLFKRIIARINLERATMIMRRRFVYASIVFLSATVITIPAWLAFWSDFTQSGFAQYVSLMFYDFKIVLAHWQDFGLSLLETFPIVSTTVLLSLIFAILVSLSLSLKYIKGFRKSALNN